MIAACGLPMRRRLAMVAAAICLPVLAAAYQLAAVEVARRGGAAASWQEWIVTLAHTPWMLMLLLAEVTSFAIWMLVLGELPLSVAFPLTATGAVFSLALAVLVLGEVVPPLAWLGIGAILSGAWLVVRQSR